MIFVKDSDLNILLPLKVLHQHNSKNWVRFQSNVCDGLEMFIHIIPFMNVTDAFFDGAQNWVEEFSRFPPGVRGLLSNASWSMTPLVQRIQLLQLVEHTMRDVWLNPAWTS